MAGQSLKIKEEFMEKKKSHGIPNDFVVVGKNKASWGVDAGVRRGDMKYNQVVIPDIRNTYLSGFVLINIPDDYSSVRVELSAQEVADIKKYLEHPEIFSPFKYEKDFDLFLEKDLEGGYFFSQQYKKFSFFEGVLIACIFDKKVYFKK